MKLLTFRRLKMKPAAKSKNLLPQARTRMNTHTQAMTKDLTSVLGLGIVEAVYIGADLQSWLIDPIETKGSTSSPDSSLNPG